MTDQSEDGHLNDESEFEICERSQVGARRDSYRCPEEERVKEQGSEE